MELASDSKIKIYFIVCDNNIPSRSTYDNLDICQFLSQ